MANASSTFVSFLGKCLYWPPKFLALLSFRANTSIDSPDAKKGTVLGLSAVTIATKECGGLWPLPGALRFVGLYSAFTIIVTHAARDGGSGHDSETPDGA